MIELAIVLPVLLTILLGIFYFAEFMNFSTDETHLAAEAVRFAAANNNPGSGTLQSYVQSQATHPLQAGTGDVTSAAKLYIYYPTGSSGTVGSAVRACVTATVKFLPFLGLGSATITQSATERLEQTATNWTPDATSGVDSHCPTS